MFMCREISTLKFATCCQVYSNCYQPELDWKEFHLSSRCKSEISAMELGENRPCLRNGERESEEREGDGIPRLPLERSKCHFCLNTMIFVWRERLSCFCPGSKVHGCEPENKPLRISETTLTYDCGEGERYSMPLAPAARLPNAKVKYQWQIGRKEERHQRLRADNLY